MQWPAAAGALIGCLASPAFVVPAQAETVFAAVAAIGKGGAGHLADIQAVGDLGRQAEHPLHHRLPLGAMGRGPAPERKHQQMRHLMGDHLLQSYNFV